MKYSKTFLLNQPVNVVFPLFSAEGEKHWVPGWDYTNVMGYVDLHEDYVFLTQNHDHAGTDAIWLVKRYEPENYHVQFYKVEPHEKVVIISVTCCSLNRTQTNVQVTYEYLALSERGQAFIDGFSAGDYENFMAEWQTLLTAYFDD